MAEPLPRLGPWTLRLPVARPPAEVWPLVERVAVRSGSDKVAWSPPRAHVRFPVGWSVRRRPLGGCVVECYLHAAPDLHITEDEKSAVWAEMLCLRAAALPSHARRAEASASVVIEGVGPEQVWEVIRPAEAALLSEGTVEAYVEHGTGPGVGEVQVSVNLVHGHRVARRSRVVAETPPYSAETVSLDGLPSSASRFTVEEVPGGTRVTFTTRMMVAQEVHMDETEMSRHNEAWLTAVKRFLESG